MDRFERSAHLIKTINESRQGVTPSPELLNEVSSFFNEVKDEDLSEADFLFMRYIAVSCGVPQYYSMLGNFVDGFDENLSDVGLDEFSMMVRESAMHTTEGTMLHRFQWDVLNRFEQGHRNRVFLSATTSFGKTFLVYEVVRKMSYRNIALIFPTISLLSENLFKIFTDSEYSWIKENYKIHTLSDVQEFGERNIFIYTPERYLSFLDKNAGVSLDFVFVDEVYKLDNSFIIDEVAKENERDVAYRLALHELLRNANTDALLVGPYIVLPDDANNQQSSFKVFLNHYGFLIEDFNQFDIVSKVEVPVKTAKRIEVGDEFVLLFESNSKKDHVIGLVKQLLKRNENAIVYCSKKPQTEQWAEALIEGRGALPEVNNARLAILTNHLEGLFAERKGAQWIVTKALKRGVGIHHGLVPKYIQQEIINLFNDGILKVLICTTTITEGVNTTAKNMIVLSGNKGTKPLKKFDAQNIEGRAGRFMKHYQGRVFVLDSEFTKRMESEDDPIRHKLYEVTDDKQDVDLLLMEPQYLTERQSERKNALEDMRVRRLMPEACFDAFKTVSYDDKLLLYKIIARYTPAEHTKINDLISKFVGQKRTTREGLDLICRTIRPIIRNGKLRFLVENGHTDRNHCYLVDMIGAFVANGFAGSANYYIRKEQDVDRGIRLASEFVFNILRYQVVKYFGLFNLLYKNCVASLRGCGVDEVSGIEALLLRFEYCADTMLGRKASDIGASFDVVKYYDIIEQEPDNQEKIQQAYNQLDDFEKANVERIRQIL